MESATPAPGFGLSAIGQVAITVTDIERAVAFYRDQLGMKLLFQVPKMGFFDLSIFYNIMGVLESDQQRMLDLFGRFLSF